MSKKKNNNSSSMPNNSQPRDLYNVKENLKKLRSGNGKDAYETDSQIVNTKSNDKYYGSGYKEDFSEYSSTSTIDRFDKISDKFSSDLTILKESLDEHKEKVYDRLIEKVDKSEFKYWIGGIIAGIIAIGTLIYTLSYQTVINDVNNLKDNKNEVQNSLIKIDYRIQNLEEKNKEKLDNKIKH